MLNRNIGAISNEACLCIIYNNAIYTSFSQSTGNVPTFGNFPNYLKSLGIVSDDTGDGLLNKGD